MDDTHIFKTQRINWGQERFPLPRIDLTEISRKSYAQFLESGISEYLSEISPVEDYTGKNYTLIFGEHSYGQSKYPPKEAMRKGLTYDMPLKVRVKLINKQTGKTIEQEVFLGDIPRMTEVGTFIINGIERCVVNQLVRSPGIFYTGSVDVITGRMLYMAELRPLRGAWLEFNVARNDFLYVKIDRRRKFPVTTFLRAIGIGADEEIFKLFESIDTHSDHHFIASTIEKDQTRSTDEALIEIYQKLRPGEPAVLDNAREFLFNLFFNPRRYNLGKVGRFKINKKLGLKLDDSEKNLILTKEDIVAAISHLIKLQNGQGEIDDIDHLSNRRLRCVGELVGLNAYRVGVLRLEKTIREKMSLSSPEETLTPSQLVNARPIIAAINDFFRRSQLSAILDQTNPLSEVDNLRRLSVMGTGGVSRERASFSIRDINSSQYSRICPIRSPEGPNIGLVTYMALYARVNDYGFLEAPYRKVVIEKKGNLSNASHGKQRARITDEVVYLMADEEQNYHVTHAGINIDRNGYILDERVAVRYKGEFLEEEATEVELIDLTPRQVVGTSASLIPFLAHDEANRALMGTNMQCQAVPLLYPQSPIIGTGMEKKVASAMGRVVYARHSGKVIYVDGEKISLKISAKDKKSEGQKDTEAIRIEGNKENYLIEKFRRTSQSTCFSQRPKVKVGQKVKKDDVIIDGPATEDGELALGQNLVIAYMSYQGLGYEDAIVISDRLVKEDVLTSINIEEYEAAVVDTKLGPEETTRDIPNVSEADLANLDENGIVVVGSKVGPNDILVGKIAPKGETELTAEERLLRAIFGEKAREVRDTSLRIPHGERGMVIEITILDKEKGDELEPGTNRLIKIKVAQERKVVVGDKLAGRHGNKGVISKIVPLADMPYLSDGTQIDIIISPLSVLARMNLGQLLEAHLGWAAQKKKVKMAIPVFEKVSEEKIIKELKEANLPIDGKTIVYDGKTGEPFERPVVVGVEYIMKLIHMVEDKTHARSTGSYSLVTQQPLGGKAQMGGQRLGEMEVWALEAHKAAFTLQEMLTIKSDDVVGRAKAFESIVKGTDIPASLIPESFKVLVKELNSLGLDVQPLEVKLASLAPLPEEAQEEKVKKEAKELAEAAGAKLVEEVKTGEKEISVKENSKTL